MTRGGRGSRQEIAAFTSSTTFFSTTGLHRRSAPEVQRHVHRVAVGQNAEDAASDLGDEVIDTTNLGLEEAIEQAL
jgi:hypothetical protein